jgi:hypothetical protein
MGCGCIDCKRFLSFRHFEVLELSEPVELDGLWLVVKSSPIDCGTAGMVCRLM